MLHHAVWCHHLGKWTAQTRVLHWPPGRSLACRRPWTRRNCLCKPWARFVLRTGFPETASALLGSFPFLLLAKLGAAFPCSVSFRIFKPSDPVANLAFLNFLQDASRLIASIGKLLLLVVVVFLSVGVCQGRRGFQLRHPALHLAVRCCPEQL